MSPFYIERLLRIHYRGEDEPQLAELEAGFGYDAYREFVAEMLAAGVVRRDFTDPLKTHHLTDRGRAYVQLLEDTPLPVIQWV